MSIWTSKAAVSAAVIGNAQYQITVSAHIHHPGTLVMRLVDNNSRAALIDLRDLHTTDIGEARREALYVAAEYFQRARNNMVVALEDIEAALA